MSDFTSDANLPRRLYCELMAGLDEEQDEVVFHGPLTKHLVTLPQRKAALMRIAHYTAREMKKEREWSRIRNAACALYDLDAITSSRAAEIIGCSIWDFRDMYLAHQNAPAKPQNAPAKPEDLVTALDEIRMLAAYWLGRARQEAAGG